MGSILSKIAEDYDEYWELCQSLKISPKGVTDDFYEHQKQVLNQVGDEQGSSLEPSVNSTRIEDDPEKRHWDNLATFNERFSDHGEDY